jgi:hypothetical protein
VERHVDSTQVSAGKPTERKGTFVVAPLAATGSLWAVLLAALVIGRHGMIGRRTIASGLLVLAGGALIASTQ